ncbi:polymer-forming cytoskeletal protein [Haloferax namakaokahaiae]|uniref:Polymer-forming cytoskeletal protein n=1 Tax=Haloferax namakaokahaiae TaxID=1748331 RepID=A0ABD5ZF92_9EURY
MRIAKSLVALALTVLLLGSLVGVAAAQQEPTAGGTIVVEEGEIYTGDLQATGGTVIIAGIVDGDVEFAAGTVLVTNTGRVTGSLDGVAGSVTIEGAVDGDVNVAAGALFLRSGSIVGGDLEAGAGSVAIDGAVAGDATVGAEELTVGPNARIAGALEYDAETATIDDGATVTGGATRVSNLEIAGPSIFGMSAGFGQFDAPIIPQWMVAGYWLLVNVALGAIVVLVAPGFARRVTGLGTKKAVRSGGVGLLAIVGVPIVLLVLLLTIVGIPLSLVGGIAFLVVLWVASIYGALVLGTWLLSLGDYANRWAALALGLLIVAILDFVPFVGGILEFLVLLVGLGAFVLALRGESGDETEGMGTPGEGPEEGAPMT